MDLRFVLYQLTAAHGLDGQHARRLRHLAGLDAPPATLLGDLGRGLAVVAAGLVGFGVILWLAANWDTLGRFGRFALLQGTVLVMTLGAWRRPAARAPLGLLAFLATGGLLAYFGQTYQTGADPWQLFAWWAALMVPLCLGVRSDVVWAPWGLVAMTGLALWVQAHTDHTWRVDRSNLGLQWATWTGAIVLTVFLGPLARRWTGAGVWSWRLSLLLTVGCITVASLGGLFGDHVGKLYGVGVLVLLAASSWLSRPAHLDMFSLCVLVLALNILFGGGWARVLLSGSSSSELGALMMGGLISAGLLAMSVQWVLQRGRVAQSSVTMGDVE